MNLYSVHNLSSMLSQILQKGVNVIHNSVCMYYTVYEAGILVYLSWDSFIFFSLIVFYSRIFSLVMINVNYELWNCRHYPKFPEICISGNEWVLVQPNAASNSEIHFLWVSIHSSLHKKQGLHSIRITEWLKRLCTVVWYFMTQHTTEYIKGISNIWL